MKVCVLGAGVVGCATAWLLASRGADVVVFERDEIASGASGGLGLRGVRANGRDPAELPLARRALEMWPTFGASTHFERVGHLHLVEENEDIAGVVERQTAAGIPCEIVSDGVLHELEPDLHPRVLAAVHCPGDGVADHTATTRGFAAAARRAGADFRERCRAELALDGGVIAVQANGRRHDADAVLVASNAGARNALETVGVRLPTANVWPQVVVTEPLDRVVVRHLIGHASRPLAIKTLSDRAVMITGGRLGHDGEVDDGEVDANVADAVAMFPALEGVRVKAAVADRAESVTRDLLPVVDRIPGTSNGFVAAGWSGHGWAIAPAVAEALAVWIREGRRPSSLAPFELARLP